MNESSLTQSFQKDLRDRGYFVMKHSDRFTKGVPDTSASKHGVTTWLEFKAIKLKRYKRSFDWSRVIDNQVQLATMVSLERYAVAKYVLFEIVDGFHETFICSPTNVWYSVSNKKAVLMHPYTKGDF